MNRQTKILKSTVAATVLAMGLGGASATLAGSNSDYSGAMHDAWVDGKVETAFALNPHLNPFSIDTDVENGTVWLTGTVESDIDRDLAGEIALSVDGVKKVENKLEVAKMEKSSMEKATDNFMQHVSDATTTATVKTKLLANGNTKGLQINVDTNDNVVTLRGTVGSDEIRDLAEALAENTDNVERVENELKVMKGS